MIFLKQYGFFEVIMINKMSAIKLLSVFSLTQFLFISVLEELIRQMTTYRIDDFNDDIEDFDSNELLDQNDESVSTEADDYTSVLTEAVEPQIAQTTRKDEPVVVKERTVFKTKCQMMHEEIENGWYPYFSMYFV